MCLGLILRTYHIANFGLFGDEKQSVLIAVGNTNFGGMSTLINPPAVFTPADFWAPRGIQAWLDVDARGDVSGNSLFHDMMLKLVANVFGKGDGALRSVSVFFNMLTLWLLFYWARRQKIHEFYWPLGILLLAILEPFFIIFSQQARNYTTSIFFSTASNYFFWKMIIQRNEIERPNTKDVMGWAFSSLFALFSTYLTALVLVGQLIYMFIRLPKWVVWQKLLLGSLIILIPFVAWMFVMLLLPKVIQLKKEGKIKNFGVSNFTTSQVELLAEHTSIEHHQVEISVTHLNAFNDGTLDQCQLKNISAQAWSPWGNGLFTDKTEKNIRILSTAEELAAQYETGVNEILLAFLYAHPASIVPVIGTTKFERIKQAKASMEINLAREDFYKLWCASTGAEVA